MTVVVPVRDRMAQLDLLLGSLHRAGERDHRDRPARVVVVDDGSVDGSGHRRVTVNHGAAYVRRNRSEGPGRARDDGIEAALTPLVAVLDSDCVVTPGWLSPLLAHFADETVAAAAARILAVARGESPAGALHRYEASRSPLDMGPDPGRVAPRTRIAYVPAAGVVLRREAYDQVGGFDPDLLVGEDVDLIWRLVGAGWRVRYEPESEVVHEVRSGIGPWLHQRFGYGTSAALLDLRHPGLTAPVSCSPWSLVAWTAAAVGHPVLGAGVAIGSASLLPRRLPGLAVAESLRLAMAGHLGAGRLLARAVVRVWWPAALVAGVFFRRARRVIAVSAVLVVVDAGVAARAATRSTAGDGGDQVRMPNPVAFAALTLADDVAYGAGVWVGCLRVRSFRSLLPSLPRWPARQDR